MGVVRRCGWLFGGLAWALGFAAQAQPSPEQARVAEVVQQVHGVAIALGERIELSVAAGGAPTLIARGPAQGPGFVGPQAVDGRVETLAPFQAPPITAKPQTLVATLRPMTGGGFKLELENGFDHPILYDAVLVGRRRNGELTVVKTTICPVRARAPGVESWGGQGIVAIVLSQVRQPPPGDMACSGESGLVVADTAKPSNLCVAKADGTPLTVRLEVDAATGARRSAEASLEFPEGNGFPQFSLNYPMQRGMTGTRPMAVVVIAYAPLRPLPAATSATVVLSADGKEAVRRPWRAYAANRAAAAADTQPQGKRAAAVVGSIPFPLQDDNGVVDPAIDALFSAISRGEVDRLEARIEGDDGTVLGRSVGSLKPSIIDNGALVAAILRRAEAMAAAPGHCAEVKAAAN